MMRRIGLLLSILAWALATGCDRSYDAPPQVDLDNPVTVDVAEAILRSGDEPVLYSGSVEPIERATIASKMMGQVEFVRVSEGDVVAKGDPLVKLQSQDIDAKLMQAEAGIRESKILYDNASTDLKRYESLFAKKTATQKELDDMRAAHASAEARYQVAVENKRAVEELLEHVRITAPFGGVVTRKFLDVGDLATPGRPIIQIEDTRSLEILAKVPESDIQSLNVGMPVTVIIPSNVGVTDDESYEGESLLRRFAARIHQVLPSADPTSHQFEIKAKLDNPGGAIKTGMFARIEVTKRGQQTLTVPRRAIVERGQLEGIFVVDEEDRAHLRWIRTGREREDEVEVIAGLDPGETIVTQSESRLRDGQKVTVKR